MSIQYAIVGMMVGILIPLLLPYTLQELGGTKEDYGIVMLCFGLRWSHRGIGIKQDR